MAKRKGLGRGLDALLSGVQTPVEGEEAPTGELRQLPVDLVARGRYQPRLAIHAEALERLAEIDTILGNKPTGERDWRDG